MRVSRTIYSHYAQARCHDFDPASPIPHTAILEIEMEEPKIIQIGSYSPSSACNAKVLDVDGICPTLLDHKGAEPAILTPIRTEEQRQLRKQGIDTFGGRQLLPRTDGVSNTITTVQKDNLLREPYQVIGSMQANAMRGSIDGVSPCLTEAMGMGGGQIPMIVQNVHGYNKGGVFEDVAPTVTSSAYQNNNHLVEPSILGYTRDEKGGIQNYHEREVAGTIHTSSGSGGNTDQFVITKQKRHEETDKRRIYPISDEANSREILSILWQEIGEETFQRAIRRLSSILKKEILRFAVYEDGICEERDNHSELGRSTCVSTKNCISNRESFKGLRDLWSDTERGYTPQGWQPSEQYLRELDACLSELSHEAPQTSECLRNMWQRGTYSPWYVRQTLHSLEKVWRPQSQAVEYVPKVRYRIRKLTERECFRLQGVDDSDIDKLKSAKLTQTLKGGKVKEKPMPKTQLYKMAGNSIVVDVLYYIFKAMFVDEPLKPKPIQKSLFDQ